MSNTSVALLKPKNGKRLSFNLEGELAVDFPEDVKIPVEPNQMVTAELVGSSIKFSYCELSRASAYLKEQYAVGTVEIKVVQQTSIR
jgi:inner membrane protein